MNRFRKWLIHKLGGYTESYVKINKDGIEVISGNKISFRSAENLISEVTKDEN